MDNILQDIIQREEEALRLEEEARKQSLEILTEARKEAERILEKSLAEGETLTEELLQKTRNQAIEERKQHESTYLAADEQIRIKSQEKLNEAAEFIVGRVVKKSWQW